MKFFYKEKLDNGIRNLYLLGLKVLSYKHIKNFSLDFSNADIDIQKYVALNRHKNEIINLILGSSHARDGFSPSKYYFNLGNSSLDLYRLYKLYEYCINNNFNNLKNLIIFFDVFSPGLQLEKTKEAYKTIPYKYLYNIEYQFPLSEIYRNYEKGLRKYLTAHTDIYVDNNYWGASPRNVTHDLSVTPQALTAKHLKNNSRNNGQIKFLENIFMLANKHSHKVYIVTPPYKKEYTQCLPRFEIVFKELLDLLAKYHDVTLLNFQNDNDFIDSDFDDWDHLNTKGAEKLSNKIILNIHQAAEYGENRC